MIWYVNGYLGIDDSPCLYTRENVKLAKGMSCMIVSIVSFKRSTKMGGQFRWVYHESKDAKLGPG